MHQTPAAPETTRARLREIVGSILTDEQLDRIAAAAAPAQIALRTLQVPAIGAYWPEHGGDFMGIARGDEGQPDYLLIRGPYAENNLDHPSALKTAGAFNARGFTDWDLPTRTDGALIQANGRAQMREGWHWLKETLAGDDASAWCQHFRGGVQDLTRKGYEFAVVLVRRVPIR